MAILLEVLILGAFLCSGHSAEHISHDLIPLCSAPVCIFSNVPEGLKGVEGHVFCAAASSGWQPLSY